MDTITREFYIWSSHDDSTWGRDPPYALISQCVIDDTELDLPLITSDEY